MKFKKTTLTAMALFAFSASSFGQFSFGVSPGIGLNGTYIGYKFNKFVPYFGFQYLNASYLYEETGVEYDWDLGQVVSYSWDEEFKGSVFIPNLGLKYFLSQHNQVKTYLSLSISKPFLSGKLISDGEEIEEFSDAIKNIKMWGEELGFGMEYFFDDNFSLGGEFGFRFFQLKYEDSYESEYYNPDTGEYVPSNVNNEIRFTTSPTFSKISLNFYF